MTPETIVHLLPCASTIDDCAKTLEPFTDGVAAMAVSAQVTADTNKNNLAIFFIGSTLIESRRSLVDTTKRIGRRCLCYATQVRDNGDRFQNERASANSRIAGTAASSAGRYLIGLGRFLKRG